MQPAGVSDLREAIGKAIWEAQRALIVDPEGINARLTWRSLGAPQEFWDGYVRDGDAAILTLTKATGWMYNDNVY